MIIEVTIVHEQPDGMQLYVYRLSTPILYFSLMTWVHSTVTYKMSRSMASFLKTHIHRYNFMKIDILYACEKEQLPGLEVWGALGVKLQVLLLRARFPGQTFRHNRAQVVE